MFEDLCRCEDCPLRISKAKRGFVSGEGVGEEPYEAVWVGISPAETEIKKKRPMTGPSGILGREVGRKTGYENYYITNTFLCWYPPEAEEYHLQKAADCCRPRLEAELDYIKPKVILALGNIPVRELLGRDVNVLSVEGRVFETKVGPVLPVRQPASVLYRPDEYRDLQDAFASGKNYALGKYVTAVEPKTTVVTEENIVEVLTKISNAGRALIDCETTKNGFFPYGMDPDEIRCIAMAVDLKEGFIFPSIFLSHPGLHQVIDSIEGDFHNSHFDCGFLKQAGFHPKVRYDTLLAHFLTDERSYAHGLKILAGKMLGVPDWEQELKMYLPNKKASYDLVPDEVLFPYAARDVCYNLQIVPMLEEQVSATGDGLLAKLLIPAVNMFNEIRHRGIRIDINQLMDLDGVLEKDYNDACKELEEEVGFGLNPQSPTEVIPYLYDTLRLPVIKRYGRTSNKKALRSYMDIDAVRLVVEAREANKLKSTYVAGVAKFVDPNFRIHPFTKLWGAETGRISTEDPSVMNVSKKGGIKKIYIPEEGHYLLDVDFSGIEIRVYAVLMKDQHLIELIKEGDKDPNQEIHEIVARAGTERSGRIVTRGQAKTGVFGRMYKRGIDSMQAGFQMSREDTLDFLQIIDSMFPSLAEYNTITERQIRKHGELISLFGRRRRFGYIPEDLMHEVLRQGVNFKVQSAASDINLFCMLDMWEAREELGAWPLFPVHDSILFDVEEPVVGLEIKRRMEEYATELVGGVVPFKVKIKVGKNWGEMEPLEDFLEARKKEKVYV